VPYIYIYIYIYIYYSLQNLLYFCRDVKPGAAHYVRIQVEGFRGQNSEENIYTYREKKLKGDGE